MVAALDENDPFPLHFQTGADSTVADFAKTSGEKLEQARKYRLYPFFILTNPQRMKAFGTVCPAFRAGCLVAESSEVKMASRLVHYPAVNKQIDLLLKLTPANEGTSLEVACAGRYSQAQVEKIAEALMAALEALSSGTNLKLKDVISDHILTEKMAAAAASQSTESTVSVQEELTRA